MTQDIKAPFPNCKFRLCDLPGQCIEEGKCHHPVELPASAKEGERFDHAHTLERELTQLRAELAAANAKVQEVSAELADLKQQDLHELWLSERRKVIELQIKLSKPQSET